MKDKLSKIIFIIIFLALILLMLGNNITATVNIDGIEYYTTNDIGWHKSGKRAVG